MNEKESNVWFYLAKMDEWHDYLAVKCPFTSLALQLKTVFIQFDKTYTQKNNNKMKKKNIKKEFNAMHFMAFIQSCSVVGVYNIYSYILVSFKNFGILTWI